MTEPQNELKILVQDRKTHENGQLMVGRSQFAGVLFKDYYLCRGEGGASSKSGNIEWVDTEQYVQVRTWRVILCIWWHQPSCGIICLFCQNIFLLPRWGGWENMKNKKRMLHQKSWVGHNFRIHLIIFVILWETRVLRKDFEHEPTLMTQISSPKKKLSHIWYVTMCGIIKYLIISLCFVVERVET